VHAPIACGEMTVAVISPPGWLSLRWAAHAPAKIRAWKEPGAGADSSWGFRAAKPWPSIGAVWRRFFAFTTSRHPADSDHGTPCNLERDGHGHDVRPRRYLRPHAPGTHASKGGVSFFFNTPRPAGPPAVVEVAELGSCSHL